MSQIIACGARANVRAVAASARVEPKSEKSGSSIVGVGGARSFGGAPRPALLKKAAKKGLLQRAIETGAALRAEDLRRQFPSVFIPTVGKDISYEEWFWKEMREGGVLHEYLELEKRKSARRMRSVARQMHGFEQNNKSDVRMIAAIPAREYFRWKAEDPHFFEDDKNLKSLRRDNPDAVVKL